MIASFAISQELLPLVSLYSLGTRWMFDSFLGLGGGRYTGLAGSVLGRAKGWELDMFHT